MTLLNNIDTALVRNSGEGVFDLSEAELTKFVNGLVDSDPVTISGSIGLEVDFFSRQKISEIRYYHGPDSTVSVKYSQDGLSWSAFSVVSESGYTSVSGELSSFSSWPSKLRIQHTPTGATALAYEIDVTIDGSEIVFGSDLFDVDSSQEAEISEVVLHNNTQQTRDIHCFVEADENSVYDEGVQLSDSGVGPFYGLFSKGINLPNRFAWSSGEFSGTVVSGTSVVLTTSSGVGYYTSPVFDVVSMPPFRVFWEAETTGMSYIDDFSSVDSSMTVGIRSSSVTPTGLWESGNSAHATDPVWGSVSGTLAYWPITNGSVLTGPIGREQYFQLQVTFVTLVSGTTPVLSSLGLEEATTISGVLSDSFATLYVTTDFGSYVAGQTAGIMSFFQE